MGALQQKFGLTLFTNTCISKTNQNNHIEDGRRQKEGSCCTSYVVWDILNINIRLANKTRTYVKISTVTTNRSLQGYTTKKLAEEKKMTPQCLLKKYKKVQLQ